MLGNLRRDGGCGAEAGTPQGRPQEGAAPVGGQVCSLEGSSNTRAPGGSCWAVSGGTWQWDMMGEGCHVWRDGRPNMEGSGLVTWGWGADEGSMTVTAQPNIRPGAALQRQFTCTPGRTGLSPLPSHTHEGTWLNSPQDTRSKSAAAQGGDRGFKNPTGTVGLAGLASSFRN